jgi:hypothetical protein
VARVFVAFVCVPFGVDFETVVESLERNLRLPFTPSGRHFRSFSWAKSAHGSSSPTQ